MTINLKAHCYLTSSQFYTTPSGVPSLPFGVSPPPGTPAPFNMPSACAMT